MLQALMLQALPVNATADLNGVRCNAVRRKVVPPGNDTRITIVSSRHSTGDLPRQH